MWISRNRLRLVVALMCTALILAACGDSESGSTTEPEEVTTTEGSTDTTQSSDTTQPVVDTTQAMECPEMSEFVLATPGDPPNFVQITPALADALGYMEEFCVSIEFVPFPSALDALRAMQAGEADAAMAGTVSPVNAIGGGSPIAVWTSGAHDFDYQAVATVASGITSCEEIAGNSVIASQPGSLVYTVTENYLASCGLDIESDVELIIGSPDDFGAQMEQGLADVAVMHADEAIVFPAQRDVEFTILADLWGSPDNYHYLSMVSQTAVIDERAETLAGVVAAMLKANQWATDPANAGAFADMVVELTDLEADPAAQMVEIFASVFPVGCDQALSQDLIQNVIDGETEKGNLTTELTYDDIVRLDVCQAGEALLG